VDVAAEHHDARLVEEHGCAGTPRTAAARSASPAMDGDRVDVMAHAVAIGKPTVEPTMTGFSFGTHFVDLLELLRAGLRVSPSRAASCGTA
jgi:hypothetical protein